jgi:hypothetical protein
MITSDINIKLSNGKSDLAGMIDALDKSARPTVGDLLYAGQRQRTRILERTARGVDVDEVAFKGYSASGPYYYYPGKNAKNRRGAVLRMARKLGVAAKGGPNRKGEKITGFGIKFPTYGAFKRSLGRTGVDLRGPSAPHMLQAIIVKAAGIVLPGTDDRQGNLFDTNSAEFTNDTYANEIVIGIYGEEAKRANAHNSGYKNIPKRRFMGASESDKLAVLKDIGDRILARVKKALMGVS